MERKSKKAAFLLSILFFSGSPAVDAQMESSSQKKQSEKQGPRISEKAKKASLSRSEKSNYSLVGNNFSRKYHKPHCEFASKINIYHVKLIKTSEEARQLKYKACNWCMPKWSKSVNSKLIKQ